MITDNPNLRSDEILNSVLNSLPFTEEMKESSLKFLKIRTELSKESDRGMALYATAHIDSELDYLLRKKLIGGQKHLESIFSFNGPLGTFSAKIKLAFSLGLIDEITMNDINTLRKIRNEFAHSDKSIDFKTQKIKDLCSNLKLNVKELESPDRHKFINVVAGISGMLYGASIVANKFEEPEDIDLDKRKKELNSFLEIIINTFS